MKGIKIKPLSKILKTTVRSFCKKEGKVKVIKLGNEDYRNLGRKFSPQEVEKYLDPFGFINDSKESMSAEQLQKEIQTQKEEYERREKKEEVKMSNTESDSSDTSNTKASSDKKEGTKERTKLSKEYGMKPKGPEPTRYGDWERNGKCVDF
mmetsp:Transcript_641/g.639  ORF Transcript_641/g.639 Transcript_641/m.639 type:complete len:151 (+) Transcript_641:7-459(+)